MEPRRQLSGHCHILLMVGFSATLLHAANWEGAKVEQQVIDASPHPANTATAFDVSATRNGCRVAKLVGNTLDGFAVRVDGVDGPVWSEIASGTPLFSEDGSSFAYCARRGFEWRWVINGTEGPAFPEMTATSFAFSADGKRHAYIALPGFRRVVLVVDGKPGPDTARDKPQPWDAAPLFTPDGSRLAYVEVLHEQRQMRVNLDGKPGPWYQAIAMVQSRGFGASFGHDTAAPAPVAATAALAASQLRPGIFGMTFSADGKHFATRAQIDGRWSVVMDGVVGPAYDAIGFDFIMTPDGSDHAFLAKDAAGYSIVRGKGRPLPVELANDWTLTFSPDGRHLAFMGEQRGKAGVWVDGVPAPSDVVIANTKNYGSIRFSPDSRRLAFAVESAAPLLHWVVDGKAGPGTTLALGQFDFSQDSAHFAYVLPRQESQDVAIVVDGKIRASHPTVACGPAFRHDGTLEYLAWDGSTLQRFRVTGY